MPLGVPSMMAHCSFKTFENAGASSINVGILVRVAVLPVCDHSSGSPTLVLAETLRRVTGVSSANAVTFSYGCSGAKVAPGGAKITASKPSEPAVVATCKRARLKTCRSRVRSPPGVPLGFP